MEVMVELDERRRLSLGKIGHHTRYLVHEESDGTLIMQPAVVMTEFEAKLLASPQVTDQIRASQADPSRRRHRSPRQAGRAGGSAT